MNAASDHTLPRNLKNSLRSFVNDIRIKTKQAIVQQIIANKRQYYTTLIIRNNPNSEYKER